MRATLLALAILAAAASSPAAAQARVDALDIAVNPDRHLNRSVTTTLRCYFAGDRDFRCLDLEANLLVLSERIAEPAGTAIRQRCAELRRLATGCRFEVTFTAIKASHDTVAGGQARTILEAFAVSARAR